MGIELKLQRVELGLNESRYHSLALSRLLARFAYQVFDPRRRVRRHDPKDAEQNEFRSFVERRNSGEHDRIDRIDHQWNSIRSPQPSEKGRVFDKRQCRDKRSLAN